MIMLAIPLNNAARLQWKNDGQSHWYYSRIELCYKLMVVETLPISSLLRLEGLALFKLGYKPPFGPTALRVVLLDELTMF